MDWKLDHGSSGGPVKDRLVQSREPGHRTKSQLRRWTEAGFRPKNQVFEAEQSGDGGWQLVA